jgi:hypothetical protein
MKRCIERFRNNAVKELTKNIDKRYAIFIEKRYANQWIQSIAYSIQSKLKLNATVFKELYFWLLAGLLKKLRIAVKDWCECDFADIFADMQPIKENL